MIETVNTSLAPAALGHYSHATVSRGVAYLSGQLPLDPKNPDSPLGSIEEQTLQTLHNVQTVLEAAGSDKSLVLKVTIYMSDMLYWPTINRIYGEFFGSHKPARSAVPVPILPRNCALEIDVIAAVK